MLPWPFPVFTPHPPLSGLPEKRGRGVENLSRPSIIVGMSTYYFAPVYGPKDQLVRYAGVTVEATPPEMRQRKPEKGKRLAPLNTGRNAAFTAIKATLAPGERVARRGRQVRKSEELKPRFDFHAPIIARHAGIVYNGGIPLQERNKT